MHKHQSADYRLNPCDANKFGIVGDGVTDDTAAIKHAIDVQGIVSLCSGEYRLPEAFRLLGKPLRSDL